MRKNTKTPKKVRQPINPGPGDRAKVKELLLAAVESCLVENPNNPHGMQTPGKGEIRNLMMEIGKCVVVNSDIKGRVVGLVYLLAARNDLDVRIKRVRALWRERSEVISGLGVRYENFSLANSLMRMAHDTESEIVEWIMECPEDLIRAFGYPTCSENSEAKLSETLNIHRRPYRLSWCVSNMFEGAANAQRGADGQ